MTSTSSLPKLFTAARERIRARRAERAAYLTLVRELSAYNTPADRMELDAILARHSEADAALVQGILNRLKVA